MFDKNAVRLAPYKAHHDSGLFSEILFGVLDGLVSCLLEVFLEVSSVSVGI